MTITNYSDLQTTIADYAHRSDLVSRIPVFITLAESRINRLLDLSTQEIEVNLTMTIGSRFVPYPATMNTPIALWTTAYQPRQELTPKLASDLPVINVSGIPEYWAIDGANIAFEMAADKAYGFTFRYRNSVSLSALAPTNSILIIYPDAYLYGALMEQAIFANDDTNAAKWKTFFEIAIQQINDDQNRNRSIAPLATDIPVTFPRGSRFNIFRGY